MLAEARATADAGAFALVIEGVAEGLAREITEARAVPTIGIGASAGCDGQILVTDDMLGLFDWTPKFVRRYADLRGEIGRAARRLRRGRARAPVPGRGGDLFRAQALSGYRSAPCRRRWRGRYRVRALITLERRSLVADVFEEVEERAAGRPLHARWPRALLPWIVGAAGAGAGRGPRRLGLRRVAPRARPPKASETYAAALEACAGDRPRAERLFREVAESGSPVYKALALQQLAGLQGRRQPAARGRAAARPGGRGRARARCSRTPPG